jgi:hypothetical protein
MSQHFLKILASSIPRVHGNQVKTDRVDAGKLAQFLSAGILTFVTVPDVETEKDRDFMRSLQGNPKICLQQMKWLMEKNTNH